MTKAIRCFSNVTLLPLPPYSPELNPVEQLWQQIKQRFLSNTTFQNYVQRALLIIKPQQIKTTI
jgi:transposase